MTTERARPWTRTNAARRIRSPNEQWADEIEARLTESCHPWQSNALLDPSRRISVLCGRGAGKTTMMKARAILAMARIPRARVIYCAASRANAKDLMWFPLKDTLEQLGFVLGRDVHYHETELRCTFAKTGAMLRLVGIDDEAEINKLRGQPFDLVLLDEASIYRPELLENLIFRVIGPRLGDRLGTLMIGGTPSHILRGPFYDATRPGSNVHRPYVERDNPDFASWIGWSSHAWTLKDVAELPDAPPALVNLWNSALEEKKRNQWSDEHPVWVREFLGTWAADNTENVFKYRPHVDGKPWNEWDPLDGSKAEGLLALRTAIAALPEEHQDWHYVIGMDEGSADPFALNVFAFAPSDASRTIWHVFGYEKTKMYAKPIAEMLLGERLNADKPDGILGAVGWPDAMILDGGQPLIDELGNVYGIRVAKHDRRRDYKFAAVELCNGDLIDGRIKVLKGSLLAQQLGELQWQEDQYGNLRENKAQANHSSDTLLMARLAIAKLFESGAVEAESKAPKRETKPTPGDPDFGIRERGEFDSMFGKPDETFDDMFDSFGNVDFGNF